MTPNKRIKYLREYYNLDIDFFASLLNIPTVELANIESGAHPLSDDIIKKITELLWIEEDWLRTGKNEMEKSLSVAYCNENKDNIELLRSIFKILGVSNKKQREYLSVMCLEYIYLLNSPIKSTLKSSVLKSAWFVAEHIEKYSTHHIVRKKAIINALKNKPIQHINELAYEIRKFYEEILIELFHCTNLERTCDICKKKYKNLMPAYRHIGFLIDYIQVCENCFKICDDIHFFE